MEWPWEQDCQVYCDEVDQLRLTASKKQRKRPLLCAIARFRP